jgi:ATP-dependent helicase HepA
MGSHFKVGQMVCLRVDPSRQGPIIETLPSVGGRARYRVFHSPQEIRDYYEDQLLAVEAWPAQYSRAIAHLELLRIDEYLRGVNRRQSHYGLLTLDPPPHFSLLIVDEAHHVRNPGTNSHELTRFLCDVSEAVLFLSATPVHLGSQNLYTLLNLLRPDLFLDEAVFDAIIQPNQYLTQAMRCIRSHASGDNWQQEAATALKHAAHTYWGQQDLNKDPRLMYWLSELQQAKPLTDADRVRCLRDLEEVHSLAHIMNRTRRRDIGRFTIREPHTVSIPFTPEQQRLYDTLIDFRRELLSLIYNPPVARLITDTLERQAASCLHALVPTIEGFLRSGRFSLSDLSDDEEVDATVAALPVELRQRAVELRHLAAQLSPDDPKLNHLFAIVQTAITADGPKGVFLFPAYFGVSGAAAP